MREARRTWLFCWGNDRDFCKVIGETKSDQYFPGARPYSNAGSDLSECTGRLVNVDMDIWVSGKGHSADEAANASTTTKALEPMTWENIKIDSVPDRDSKLLDRHEIGRSEGRSGTSVGVDLNRRSGIYSRGVSLGGMEDERRDSQADSKQTYLSDSHMCRGYVETLREGDGCAKER